MAATCANFVFPGVSNSAAPGVAKILIDQPFGNTIPAGCNTPYDSMTGATPNASSVVFVMTPDFNWAGCTGNNGVTQVNGNPNDICFGAKMIGENYMSFFGGGLNGTGACTGASGKTVTAPYATDNQNFFLILNGICPGTGLLEGYELDGVDETVTWGGAINVGQYSCVIAAAGDSQFYVDCENQGSVVTGNACASSGIGICTGEYVSATGSLQDFGSIRLQTVFHYGYVQSRGSVICGFVQTNDPGGYAINGNGAAAKWLSDGDYINSANCATSGGGVTISNGAIAYVKNTTFTQTAGFTDINLSSSGTNYFFDQCGNTFPNFSIGTLITIGTTSGVIGDCSVTGSPLVTGNIVLSANWGSTRAASAFSGFTSPMTFTITNGAATTGAAPTIAYTFPTQYLQTPLWCMASQVGGTNPTGTFTTSSLSATGVTLTYSLTPTINLTEVIQVSCVSQR